MKARIVVAEDDRKQAELLRLYLEREGHAVAVAADGRVALELIRELEPDLAVLDIMMPKVDGLDVARVLRAEGRTLPIIMVTARATEDDMLLGLDLGADDYITKPYSPRELVTRVRALLRRSSVVKEAAEVLRVGAIEVDVGRHEVRRNGDLVECTPKEFAILATLAAEPNRVFTRSQLLEKAFGFDYFGVERTVDVHVMNLRKKLEDDPADPQILETVYGVGYRMVDRA
jgi:DNA-binding response OmpR family regulator